MNWIAVLDILIAAFVIYQALVFIQGRRAMHMVVGVGLVVLFFYFFRRCFLTSCF
jgi:DNA integrity scanning protein DisA with diadenylate cyclase activity